MNPTYYISRSSSGEGYVLLSGLFLFENHYSNEVLQGNARLYAVFDTLEGTTHSTSNFVLYHDNGVRIDLEWTEAEAEAEGTDITIPLTFIHQTTNPELSEITRIDTRNYERLDQIAQIAVEELSKMKTSFKVQKRIADLVIKDAIQQELSCPITMTPFTPETARCVAPCYHIFDKEAITTWLETKNTCPECREQCSL
jgi:hypothetical protein